MRGIPYVDLDFCKFSDWGYQKPTRFWRRPNLGKLAHVRCPCRKWRNVVVDPDGNGFHHHKEILGGNAMRFNTEKKGGIPAAVVDFLLQASEFASKNRGRRTWMKGYKMHPEMRNKAPKNLGVDKEHICVDLFASTLDTQEENL